MDIENLYYEQRLAMLRGPESMAESVPELKQLAAYESKLPENERAEFRKRLESAIRRSGTPETRESNSERRSREPEQNISQGRRNTYDQLTNHSTNSSVRPERKWYNETGRTTAIIGGSAFIPSFIASLSHGGIGLSSFLMSGAAGAFFGKWWSERRKKKGKREFPIAAPIVGGCAGMAAAPVFGEVMTGIGGYMTANTTAIAGVLSTLAAGALGAGVGYKVAGKFGGGTTAKLLTSLGLGGVSATGAGYLSATALSPMVSWLGAHITGLAGWASFPSYSALGSIIAAPLSAAGVVGGSAGLLYALGRWHSKLYGLEKGGMWKNMFRGVKGSIGIPWYYATRPAGRFLGRQWGGIKRMVSGKTPSVKAVTSPIWWPVRSSYRMGRGLWRGLRNGISKSAPSELDKKQGLFAKLGRAPTYLAGRIIRSPKDIFDHLRSPGGFGWAK